MEEGSLIFILIYIDVWGCRLVLRPSDIDNFSQIFLLSRLNVKGNNIVIMSIHQPRYSIFKLFDTLTLLSAGNVVYHGQANNALEYFHGAGRF